MLATTHRQDKDKITGLHACDNPLGGGDGVSMWRNEAEGRMYHGAHRLEGHTLQKKGTEQCTTSVCQRGFNVGQRPKSPTFISKGSPKGQKEEAPRTYNTVRPNSHHETDLSTKDGEQQDNHKYIEA